MNRPYYISDMIKDPQDRIRESMELWMIKRKILFDRTQTGAIILEINRNAKLLEQKMIREQERFFNSNQ